MERIGDKLTGALIGLARATEGNEHLISEDSTAVVVESLCALADVDRDAAELEALLEKVTEQKRIMVPNCFECAAPCGRTSDYDLDGLWNAEEAVRSRKIRLLSGIRDMARRASRAAAAGRHDPEVDGFFYRALSIIGIDCFTPEELDGVLREMEQADRKCTGLLDGWQCE